MYYRVSLVVAILLGCALTVQAQSSSSFSEIGETMYYVVSRKAVVYTTPDKRTPYVRLAFREPVYVFSSRDGWSRIRTQDGAQGYVPSSSVSNMWIRVSKRHKRLYLYKGLDLVMEVAADFGYNAILDKEMRGTPANPDHWRTPDGGFFVVKKNPYSKFYKAFLLNYPTPEDAERGLKHGLITRNQYEAIMHADKMSTIPPMGTPLGGMIEIHGDGTGFSTNWTQGCVAVHNDHIDKLWSLVHEGTPVIIER